MCVRFGSAMHAQDLWSYSVALTYALLQRHSEPACCAGVKEMYNDAYGETSAHNLHTSGRLLLNIWRAMQTELKLPIYNFEACTAAILQLRVPEIPAHVISGAPS